MATTEAATTTGVIGAAIKRVEDPRLITGSARYLADLQLAGMAHVAILRSPFAHARIRSISTERAAALPGVAAVFTGQDFEHLNPLPCAWQAGGVENHVATPRALEIDRVTFAGAGVAAVVADSAAIAEDALELIDVDWEPLEVVVDAEAALADGAPQIHEGAPGNVVMDWSCGDAAATEQALAAADIVVRQRLVNQRLIPTPMETRGAAAQYDPVTGSYTVWMTSQCPHVMRLLMTAFVFGIPETKMRCISPQVGGGFGTKIFLYPEYVLVAALAEKTGRPVKWVETRRENYAATTHGRDHISYLEAGATRDGTITALRVKTYANLGGILSTIAPGIPTTLYGRMLSGAYRIPNLHCNVIGVYTNTGMVDAYRGAGRPEATYLVERMVDLVAHEAKLDPVEVRRRNFIPADAFPYQPGSNILNGLAYDTGDYTKTLDRAIEMLDLDALREEREQARGQGRLIGVGFSSYVEMCGVAPSAWIGAVGEGWGAGLWESANVRVHLTGQVVVTTGSQSHGQGHETTVAQIVADRLGVPVSDVTVEHSDTQGTPFGYGSYGSRSAAVGAIAAHASVERIVAKACRIAAHMLEADPSDIVYENGVASVKGSPDRGKTIQEIAAAAAVAYDLPEGEEPFLDDTSYYDPPNCTFPFGTHIAVVEVDGQTGEVSLRRYVAVDDVGRVINPLIVDGQVHGGIAQGIAQALWEGAVYDDNGQLQSSSLLDYGLPKAEFFPTFELDRTETRTDVNPLGVKGAGETGTIAATPAIVNAVVDALTPLGITHIDMPLTPETVWRAMQDASASRTAARG
jgi:carbon-monoxide dehydrogenase large subunit